MENRICWIYSDQELTPRAIDTIRRIKKENGYEDVKFKEATSFVTGDKVLVFGSRAPEGMWEGIEFIHTYSIAQIMAKANAVTVLTASLQMYFNGKHEPGVIPVWNTVIDRWEFDVPTAIDIETSGNLGVTHTPEEVELLSVALYQETDRRINPVTIMNNDGGIEGTVPLSQLQIEHLSRVLPKFTKAIYHNGKFDTRVLNRILGVKLCVWADTMLMHHTLNHAAGMHGLKELAQRYLGAPDWEAGISKFTKGGGHYELIPFNELVKYNGWDVYWTYQLWKLFAPQIEVDDDYIMTYEFELAIADMLLDVEMAGIPFSASAAEALESENLLKMEEELAVLREVAGENFNPNSPKQVKSVLNDTFACAVASTNEATLQQVIEQNEGRGVATWCTSLLEYRGLAKQNSTYAKGWGKQARQLDGDEQLRVRPTFLVHGTSTGRLSSTGPNAQNMPREKRVRSIVRIEE